MADDAVMRLLRVPKELAGLRLDRFLQCQLRSTSRSRSQVIVGRSAYSPDGRPLRKNRRVRAEERIVLWRPPYDDVVLAEELPVLFEDEHLLAIDKPPLIAVHPTARHHQGTVVVWLSQKRPDEHITLLHRLDRETSGVLLMAKTRAADRGVKLQLEARAGVLKQYLALARGWPASDRFTCELPLRPDSASRYRVKMGVAPAGTGLASATTFEVLGRRWAPAEPGGSATVRRYALLRCTLHTGRQHQIRVHLAALGLPVLGDKLYGPDEDLFARGADGELSDEDCRQLELLRHGLHCHVMAVDHPATGQRLRVEAPLYGDLQQFWQRLQAPA